jgi:hypothetical protein
MHSSPQMFGLNTPVQKKAARLRHSERVRYGVDEKVKYLQKTLEINGQEVAVERLLRRCNFDETATLNRYLEDGLDAPESGPRAEGQKRTNTG